MWDEHTFTREGLHRSPKWAKAIPDVLGCLSDVADGDAAYQCTGNEKNVDNALTIFGCELSPTDVIYLYLFDLHNTGKRYFHPAVFAMGIFKLSLPLKFVDFD